MIKLLQVIKSKLPIPFPALILGVVVVISIIGIILALYLSEKNSKSHQVLNLKTQLENTKKALSDFKNQDQVKINEELKIKVSNVEKNYKKAVVEYEKITDLDAQKGKTDSLKKDFAQILRDLADLNYATASGRLASLDSNIEKEKSRIATLAAPGGTAAISTASLPASNAPPGSGYSRQAVSALGSTYVVDIIAADMGSTRIIVDTATDGDCRDACPVLSLGDYVGRNGAFAGVNGSYFCPADYPTCAGKTNSFDTLAMNKNKKYINSDNNVYSTIPAVIFQSGSMRFVGQSLEWGRDTGVDGVLANQPLLLSGGNVVFGGSGDPKQGSKGNRSFVGNKGNIAYIGVVRNATVAEAANVLKALGLEGALNLDSGGSTALWSGGYKAGPGRGIPNAILFVGK